MERRATKRIVQEVTQRSNVRTLHTYGGELKEYVEKVLQVESARLHTAKENLEARVGELEKRLKMLDSKMAVTEHEQFYQAGGEQHKKNQQRGGELRMKTHSSQGGIYKEHSSQGGIYKEPHSDPLYGYGRIEEIVSGGELYTDVEIMNDNQLKQHLDGGCMYNETCGGDLLLKKSQQNIHCGGAYRRIRPRKMN